LATLLTLPPLLAALRSHSGYWFFMLPLKRGVHSARRRDLVVPTSGREVRRDFPKLMRLLLRLAGEVAFLPSGASGRTGLEFVAARAVSVLAIFAKSHRAGFGVPCDVRFHADTLCQATSHCNIYFQASLDVGWSRTTQLFVLRH
jgi:hypothetical protein